MIKKGIKQLIAEAEKKSAGISVAEARKRHGAAATLAEMGLPNVFHLQGGYGEWKKAGGPTGAREKKKS